MLSDEWFSRYGLLENFNASVTRTRTRTRTGTGTGTGTWTTGVTAIALCTSCSRANKDYLKPLPLRQSVFSFANNCVFNEVSENLFNTLIDIFDSVIKGGSKYSKFQLKWYTFSGKCLDKTTDSAFNATLTHFEQTVIESVPGSSVKRRRLSLVNALKLNTVYDPVMSKPVLVKLSICTSSVGLLHLLITGVSIIVVPFLQKMHL